MFQRVVPMSKPVFDDLFAFYGRRNRKSYLLYQLSWWGAVLLTLSICRILPVPLMVLFVIAVGGVLICSKVAVTLQRANDISVPRIVWLGLFLPFVGQVLEFVLLAMPGDSGRNRFGPDPIAPA